jgi:hypothetical protein
MTARPGMKKDGPTICHFNSRRLPEQVEILSMVHDTVWPVEAFFNSPDQ